MVQRIQRNCANCSSRRRQCRPPLPPPQIMRDFLEYLRMRQEALKQRSQANARPLQTATSCDNQNPVPTANDATNPVGTKPRPVVQLPHGLGTVTVPQGAQRVDVKFNCVTSKLANEQLKDTLVVNVDVVYNPSCGPNVATGTPNPNVTMKTEA